MSTARDRPPEEAAEDSSFARGLRLLLTVADRGEIRADDLANVLEMPLSTAYRYLRTLTEFGFVDRRDGRYRLGPRLLIGTESAVSSEELIRHADPILRMLADETGETAVVTRRVGLSAMCLHQVESMHGLRVVLEPGAMTPLYAGATSRVLLAFAPPEIVDEVVGQGLDAVTSETPSEDELRAALEKVRADGIGVSEGELIAGAVAMASPVFRQDGIVAALGLIGPEARCGLRWRSGARRLLHDATEALMAALHDAAI
jgi:DNA-binding IclR family transcriptional regulator